MDNLPQGTDTSFAARGVSVAVYLPFGFIATSRVCMAAGLHYRKGRQISAGRAVPPRVPITPARIHLFQFARSAIVIKSFC
jgi:hypothetical protein